jgi:hypothetical protein
LYIRCAVFISERDIAAGIDQQCNFVTFYKKVDTKNNNCYVTNNKSYIDIFRQERRLQAWKTNLNVLKTLKEIKMKGKYKLLLSSIIILTVTLLIQQSSFALIYPFSRTYSGANEVPPNNSTATGTISGTYDNSTKVLNFTANFTGLTAPAVAAHFHGPANIGTNAPVLIGYIGFPNVNSGTYSNTYVLTPTQETHLLAGLVYSNIHTSAFPGGEIRAQMILDAPLPVELSSFTSVIYKNNVTLKWTTSAETNNAGFDIERSATQNDWRKIGFVAGRGNSAATTDYTFSDKGISEGVYNYRLKQTDFNGNFEYFNLSNEVNIGVPSEYNLAQNYPNPFNPSTKIDFDLPENGNVSIVLYDMSGKEVATLVNEPKTAGYYSVQFNAADLSSGIYIYSIRANDFSAVRKMMLVK